MSAYSQSSGSLKLSQGVGLGDDLCLIRQVFMMYDHQREGTLTVQEVCDGCVRYRVVIL